MNERLTKIREKSVQLSAPYQASLAGMVGRDTELKKILAAWMHGGKCPPLSPLLVGEPGLGKNRIVYECAKLCAKELYIFQGHEDVTAEDLICAVRFSDDPDKKMDYIASPLVTAMIRGGICFIDEIAKIRPRALAALVSILDERRYADSILLGERVCARRGFRFIAATNTGDMDETPLPDFIRSRLRPVISVGYPERKEIDSILRSHFEEMRNDGVSLLDRFWDLWRRDEGDRPPTPRDSIYIFSYAFDLANFEMCASQPPYDLEFRAGSRAIDAQHLERAFEAFRQNLRREQSAESTDHDTARQ